MHSSPARAAAAAGSPPGQRRRAQREQSAGCPPRRNALVAAALQATEGQRQARRPTPAEPRWSEQPAHPAAGRISPSAPSDPLSAPRSRELRGAVPKRTVRGWCRVGPWAADPSLGSGHQAIQNAHCAARGAAATSMAIAHLESRPFHALPLSSLPFFTAAVRCPSACQPVVSLGKVVWRT